MPKKLFSGIVVVMKRGRQKHNSPFLGSFFKKVKYERMFRNEENRFDFYNAMTEFLEINLQEKIEKVKT